MPNLSCSKELRKLYPGEWYSWQLMWIRTSYESSPDWPAYGGRGIFVEDDSWRDFGNFLTAVKEKPEPKSFYCLARIKKNKGYHAGNVRWATRRETVENFNHWGRAQTHCKRGHLLGPGNLVRAGSRQCAKCARITRRFRYENQKNKKKDFESVHFMSSLPSLRNIVTKEK